MLEFGRFQGPDGFDTNLLKNVVDLQSLPQAGAKLPLDESQQRLAVFRQELGQRRDVVRFDAVRQFVVRFAHAAYLQIPCPLSVWHWHLASAATFHGQDARATGKRRPAAWVSVAAGRTSINPLAAGRNGCNKPARFTPQMGREGQKKG